MLKAIPKALPALMRADKVVFKAENAGVSYDEIFKNDKVYNAIENEIGELKNLSEEEISDIIGDFILKVVCISRKNQINTEFSLTKAIEKFINKFEYIESSAANNGLRLKDITATEKIRLWQEADNSAADEK